MKKLIKQAYEKGDQLKGVQTMRIDITSGSMIDENRKTLYFTYGVKMYYVRRTIKTIFGFKISDRYETNAPEEVILKLKII